MKKILLGSLMVFLGALGCGRAERSLEGQVQSENFSVESLRPKFRISAENTPQIPDIRKEGTTAVHWISFAGMIETPESIPVAWDKAHRRSNPLFLTFMKDELGKNVINADYWAEKRDELGNVTDSRERKPMSHTEEGLWYVDLMDAFPGLEGRNQPEMRLLKLDLYFADGSHHSLDVRFKLTTAAPLPILLGESLHASSPESLRDNVIHDGYVFLKQRIVNSASHPLRIWIRAQQGDLFLETYWWNPNAFNRGHLPLGRVLLAREKEKTELQDDTWMSFDVKGNSTLDLDWIAKMSTSYDLCKQATGVLPLQLIQAVLNGGWDLEIWSAETDVASRDLEAELAAERPRAHLLYRNLLHFYDRVGGNTTGTNPQYAGYCF